MKKKNDNIAAAPLSTADLTNEKAAVEETKSVDLQPDVVAEPQEPSADIIALEQKIDALQDQLLRKQAELMNVQRQASLDAEKARKFALEKFAKELLPVLDSLEKALEASTDSTASLHEGVSLTLTMLQKACHTFNIKAVNPLGEPFNADRHQAMVMQPDDKTAPNTVLQVIQKGYLLNDRLIRPALVIVAAKPQQA